MARLPARRAATSTFTHAARVSQPVICIRAKIIGGSAMRQ